MNARNSLFLEPILRVAAVGLTMFAAASAPAQETTSTTSAGGVLETRVEDGVKIEKLADGLVFPEGPVWLKEGCLIFSDIHDHKIMKLKPEGGAEPWIDFTPPRKTNGMMLSDDGTALFAAGHGELAFLEIDVKTKEVKVVSPNYEGRPYQNVNDVCVAKSGYVFWTDPKWGVKPGDVQGVYRYDPRSGETTRSVELDQQPNGLVISPDQQWLYVARSGGPDIWRYRLNADGTLSEGAQWKQLGPKENPDGMTIDTKGNLYVAQAGDGRVHVIAPDGKTIRHVNVFPRMCTNVEFENAGPGGIGDGRVLYATGGGQGDKRTGAVYRVTFPQE